MSESKLTIKIASDGSSAVQGINNVSKSLEEMSRKTNTVNARLTALSTSFIAYKNVLGTAVNGVRKAIQEASELVSIYAIQEQAQTKLASTLKATNNAVGMSAAELYNLASAYWFLEYVICYFLYSFHMP